jgi:hypothetical protein
MTRIVRANISLTLDGRYNGPGGPADLGAIVPYMTTEAARDQLARIHDGATTTVLGRRNAEGFMATGRRPTASRRPEPKKRRNEPRGLGATATASPHIHQPARRAGECWARLR